MDNREPPQQPRHRLQREGHSGEDRGLQSGGAVTERGTSRQDHVLADLLSAAAGKMSSELRRGATSTREEEVEPSPDVLMTSTASPKSKRMLNQETRQLMTAGASEFLGTGLLCFLGCMATLQGPFGSVPPHLQVALAFGTVVASIIATFAHVSGAHINPAVTVMACIVRLVSIKTAVVYIVMQCIGAVAGFGLLKAVTPYTLWVAGQPVNGTADESALWGPCCTLPHPELHPLQAMATEFIATAALMMLCGAVWDPRNASGGDVVPLKFFFLVVAVATVVGPYTGGSMNPARSMAPALVNGVWSAHWVYWIGPIAAAVVVGFGWPLFFSPPPAAEERDHADVPLTQVSTEKRKSLLSSDEDGKGAY